ncbi:MAG: polysaccharide deacetylase family protein [Planctomycetes bacterium]|nr:polysaccharide deacetylase family protein [Planctomycetota bacterium]
MSAKHAVRRLVDRAALLAGVVGALERKRRDGLTVLMYHRVLPRERCRDLPFPTLVMPADAFEDEVRWLVEHRTVLPLGEALTRLDAGRGSERPLVVLTFDDGYGDNHAVAAPILARHGARATFYVTTGFVESGGLLWFDRAALALAAAGPDALERLATRARSVAERSAARALAPDERSAVAPDARAGAGVWPDARTGAGACPDARAGAGVWIEWMKRVPRAERLVCLDALDGGAPPARAAEFAPMTRAEVEALARAGHEVGSHTVDHELLPELDDAELERQLSESRATLERWTGAPVRAFCYPNGDHDERSARAVRAAGYAHACTTGPALHCRGDDPLRVGRTDVTTVRVCGADGRHHAASFRAELSGFHELLR